MLGLLYADGGGDQGVLVSLCADVTSMQAVHTGAVHISILVRGVCCFSCAQEQAMTAAWPCQCPT